jgi:hypothetical protein
VKIMEFGAHRHALYEVPLHDLKVGVSYEIGA